jgi:hypothetical protein
MSPDAGSPMVDAGCAADKCLHLGHGCLGCEPLGEE